MRAGVWSRCVILLIPPVLLALQLLVGLGLPRAHRAGAAGEEGEDGGVSFSVISIEPKKSARHRGTSSTGGADLEEDGEVVERARGYEDENEVPTLQVGARGLELEPWAEGGPSFTAEINRLMAYITTPQVNCSRVLSPGESKASQAPGAGGPWLLCAEDWLLPAPKSPCVAYSFSMDGGDADFVQTVSGLGCEVHRFDPSHPNASGGHLADSLSGNHGDGGVASHHKMWLEWRAPRKRMHKKKRGTLGSVSQTLADIMDALGHHTIDFLYADLLSAEWRVFQNWVEHGTLQNIRHLVATVHLQWAGFEVGGTDEEVARYWFSVLRGLHAAGLQLVHSSSGEEHVVLKQTVANAHSSYTLSWVNVMH